jgi:hypothetical protein
VLHNPYLTEATVQTGQRGTPYTMQAIVETDESVTINTFKILPQIIDRADLAQSGFLKQMDLADKQAILLNESIESDFYADYGSMTAFDATQIGLSAGNITVSATNIDDIIRAVKREIRKAGGETKMEQNGAFIVWRPADLEILEGFMQANGYQTADTALRGGATQGWVMTSARLAISSPPRRASLLRVIRRFALIAVSLRIGSAREPSIKKAKSRIARLDDGVWRTRRSRALPRENQTRHRAKQFGSCSLLVLWPSCKGLAAPASPLGDTAIVL